MDRPLIYDAIVVGLGTHGSAAAAELARRGARVLGLDRFPRGHEMGSFVGRTRVTRTAYFEHPDYVPLLQRAWDRWLALERETGERVLFPTGGLYVGAPGSAIVRGVLRSVREHGLAHEVLGEAELRRHPWLRADGMVGVAEERAGYLVPERAIAAHLAVAERHGAELRFDEPADDWSPEADGSGSVNVRTSRGTLARGRSLVLTAGAWLARLLPDLALPLAVERVPLFWYEPADPAPFREIPVYIIETEQGSFYGFRYLADQGLKVAKLSTGVPAVADRLDRGLRDGEDAPVREFLERHMPAGLGPLRGWKVCMYTKTPDGHFIVDRHPRYPAVVFASACSGHGFKFASVMGEVLADLALTGSTALPVGFLSAGRFAGSGGSRGR